MFLLYYNYLVTDLSENVLIYSCLLDSKINSAPFLIEYIIIVY